MAFKKNTEQKKKREGNTYHTTRRFPERGGSDWVGPLVSYKEVELLRKFLTSSSKLMSRRRAGTNVQEQKALKTALKQARYMALIPYRGT